MYASRENAQANSLCQLISIMPVAEANAKQGHVAAQAAEAKFQSYRVPNKVAAAKGNANCKIT